ncbi:MAG: RdgB/HAM1 family non-canonical purine NTP pyrophosphatase [Herpetosiphon sp.]
MLVATTNRHKLAEYQALFAEHAEIYISLQDAGINDDVAETGTTFEANAVLKAEAYARLSGLPTLADDSGLVVDALDGRPGVYSARYGGPGATSVDQQRLLLAELTAVPWEQRTARFVCVIAYVMPGQVVRTVKGTLEGLISYEPRGSGGFGYDPLLFLPSHGRTVAELSADEKNAISHRAVAAQKLAVLLKEQKGGV